MTSGARLFVAMAAAWTLSAQTVPLSCTASADGAFEVRAEGVSELVSDIVIVCVGGTPVAAGSAIPQSVVTVRSPSADLAPKALATDGFTPWTEATLFLDEPNILSRYPCTDPSGACTGYGTGIGTGSLYYGSGAQSPSSPNNRNLFHASQTAGDLLSWTIPFDPPGAIFQRVIRLSNVRINANKFGLTAGGSAPVDLLVSMTAVTAFHEVRVRAGTARRGLQSQREQISWLPAGSAAVQKVATLRFAETFQTVFRRRSISQPSSPVTGETPPEPPSSSTGLGFPDYVGFGENTPGLPTVPGRGNLALAGTADHGTRIMARFSGIPAGAVLSVDAAAAVVVNDPAFTPRTGTARLTATDSVGAGAFSAVAANAQGRATLPVTAGSASAVWEIVNADPTSLERIEIGVYASHPAGTFPASAVLLDLAPGAPTGSAGIPRFAIQGGSSSGCTYHVTPVITDLPLEGGFYEANIIAPSGCEWQAATAAGWLGLPHPIQGNGRARIRAPFNAGPPRNATVMIGGTSFQVRQAGSSFAIPAPSVTAPSPGLVVEVSGVTFSWTAINGASGYDLRVVDASMRAVYEGTLTGSTTSQLIDIPYADLTPARPVTVPEPYTFFVRACSGAFTDASCGPFGATTFVRQPLQPPGRTRILLPAYGQRYGSTVDFQWQPVPGASFYKLVVSSGTDIVMEQTVPGTVTSLVHTLPGGGYELAIQSCSSICDGANIVRFENLVTFQAGTQFNIPPPPSLSQVSVGGNVVSLNWAQISGAESYRIEVVQPNAGPGGGALTVASQQTTLTSASLTAPAGQAFVFLKACNNVGCSSSGQGREIFVPGPNPIAPLLGTPVRGVMAAGPGVLFSWSRVPGDNGSNTTYRLYIADLSRNGAQAADVYTTSNFAGVQLATEGRRYDAVVVANPGPNQVVGPASGFQVSGTSPLSPTLTSPGHRSRSPQGNVQIGWTPVRGAKLYQYFVAVRGQSAPVATGVSAGLFVQVALSAGSSSTEYSAIVRACTNSVVEGDCTSKTDLGWGSWSNAPGGPGVTDFTVVP